MGDSKSELLSVKKRFDDECDNITNYVQLMGDITQLPRWDSVQYYIDTLKDYSLIDAESYEEDEYEIKLMNNPGELVESFRKIHSDLSDKIECFENLINCIDYNKVLRNDEIDDLDESILTYVKMGYFDEEERIEEIEKFKEFFYNQIESLLSTQERLNKDYIKEYYEKIDEKRLNLLFNKLLYEIFDSHLSILRDISAYISRFDLLMKINDSENILNVYRQGFILLIASFDAAVFDMIKVLLDSRFFEYIAKFNKDGKIKLQEMSQYENFGEFKNDVIEDGLKGKYIKDLLEILKGLDVQYISSNFHKLVECVKRRNIHLHNQGRVDSKYLENYNIFSFQESEIAIIDEEYFEDICILCQNTIQSIYDWINSKI